MDLVEVILNVLGVISYIFQIHIFENFKTLGSWDSDQHNFCEGAHTTARGKKGLSLQPDNVTLLFHN